MSDEVKFKCLGCGRCCMSHGHVYLTTKDRVLISTHLDMSVSDFTMKYCEHADGGYYLKNPDVDCCFLDGKRCSVYEVRPEQCRTWPFWPGNYCNGKFNYVGTEYCQGIIRPAE